MTIPSTELKAVESRIRNYSYLLHYLQGGVSFNPEYKP